MARFNIEYAILNEGNVEFSSTVDVSFTKKDIQEMEQFVVEHDYSPEFLDVTANVYDKCLDKAEEKAMKEYEPFADIESPLNLALPTYIPDCLIDAMNEETAAKVRANMDELLKEEADEEDDSNSDTGEEECEPFILYPNKSNTLYLPIKQIYFDEIIAGKKTEEYREIKPTTYKKFLYCTNDGNPYLSDEAPDELEYGLNTWNNGTFPFLPTPKYEYLHLVVGYNKQRDEALVELKDIIFEPAGNPVNGQCVWIAVLHLGEIIQLHKKTDSNAITLLPEKPQTKKDILDIIWSALSDEDKKIIMEADDSCEFHHGLGTWIRNVFVYGKQFENVDIVSLFEDESELDADFLRMMPDELSDCIILALIKYAKEKKDE